MFQLSDALAPLRDAVWPAWCAGCRSQQRPAIPGKGLCAACLRRLWAANPVLVTPAGSPIGCVAAAPYADVMRDCLLAYKERDQRELAAVLSQVLGATLRRVLPAARACLLVPVPATRRARRQRGFDHVARLCRRVAADSPSLTVAPVLAAGPRPDSAGLSAARRAAAARQSLRPRSGRRTQRWCDVTRSVVLIDDIVTTGATLTAATRVLDDLGLSPIGAVTLAATPRRRRGSFFRAITGDIGAIQV